MEELEKLLAQPPSEETWEAICDLLEEIEDAHSLVEAIALCEDGLSDWPDGFRVARENWNGLENINQINSRLSRLQECFDFPNDRLIDSIDWETNSKSSSFGRKVLAVAYAQDIDVLCRGYYSTSIIITLSAINQTSAKQIFIELEDIHRLFDSFIEYCGNNTFVLAYSAQIGSKGYIELHVIRENEKIKSHRISIPYVMIAPTHDGQLRALCIIDHASLAAIICQPDGLIMRIDLISGRLITRNLPIKNPSDLQVIEDKVLVVGDNAQFFFYDKLDLGDCEFSTSKVSKIFTFHFQDKLPLGNDDSYQLFPPHHWIACWQREANTSDWTLEEKVMIFPSELHMSMHLPCVRILQSNKITAVVNEMKQSNHIRVLDLPGSTATYLTLSSAHAFSIRQVCITSRQTMLLCHDSGRILEWKINKQ